MKKSEQSTSPSNVTYARIIIALFFISASLLTVEAFLQLRNLSLCPTTSCEIVGRYLQFSESLLIAFGAGFLWYCLVLFFFSTRYRGRIELLLFASLAGALAFDGSLIGFQSFTIGQFCLICLIVAFSLILLSIASCLALNRGKWALLLCCCWLGGFMSQAVLTMPMKTASAENMIIYESQPRQTGDSPTKPETVTLIFSMHCPHCLELIETVTQMDYQRIGWKLACVDRDPQALQQLTRFLAQVETDRDFLELLLRMKQSQSSEDGEAKQSSETVYQKNLESLGFLKTLGIESIPVTIHDSEADGKTIVIGKAAGLQLIKHALQTP